MASTSKNNEDCFFVLMKHFPPVINGRIHVKEFLAAATDLVALVERLGTVFTPVKLDMQGNIDKIIKYSKHNESSCLLELMLHEKAKGKLTAAEGVLWLNRALLFFEILFKEIINDLQAQIHENDVNMKKKLTTAYEGSIKVHHNWVTQQLFHLICKMSPNLPQLMKSVEAPEVNLFRRTLESYNTSLHLVRCKIDDFFADTDLLST